MDLIDRYLASVGALLPRDQRDDITAELRDVLLTHREEEEARLGRPLTRDETNALLKDFGHPLAVAGRYGRQQYLIGPEIYPVYIFVAKLVLAVIVGAALVTGVVTAVVQPRDIGHAIGVVFDIAWTGGFSAIGGVTLMFAILQWTGASRTLLGAWNPRDLPRQPTKRRGKRWYDHVAAIVCQVLFLLWWTGAMPIAWQPYVSSRPGESLRFAFTPVWHTLYLPIIGLSLLVIAVSGLKLAGWAKQRFGYGLDVALQVGVIIVAGVLLRSGQWVTVTGAGIPAGSIAKVEQAVNIGAQVTLIIVVIVAAFTLVWDAWRLYRPAASSSVRKTLST
jgi:hypothetical protein